MNIYLQRKIFLKLENEINDLNNVLYSFKEVHTSLVDEHFNVSNTLVEKVERVKFVTCQL